MVNENKEKILDYAIISALLIVSLVFLSSIGGYLNSPSGKVSIYKHGLPGGPVSVNKHTRCSYRMYTS